MGCISLIESWFNHIEECHKKKAKTWKLASSLGFNTKLGMLSLICVGMDGKIGSKWINDDDRNENHVYDDVIES